MSHYGKTGERKEGKEKRENNMGIGKIRSLYEILLAILIAAPREQMLFVPMCNDQLIWAAFRAAGVQTVHESQIVPFPII